MTNSALAKHPSPMTCSLRTLHEMSSTVAIVGRPNVSNAAEFSKLGFDRTLTISAEHNIGTGRLVEEIEELLPPPTPEEPGEKKEPALRIAIVGRPNVGKSSLANAILGDERTLVSPISGTTRDAVDIACTRGKHDYILI